LPIFFLLLIIVHGPVSAAVLTGPTVNSFRNDLPVAFSRCRALHIVGRLRWPLVSVMNAVADALAKYSGPFDWRQRRSAWAAIREAKSRM
jgi:hypothetical protein